MLATCFEGDSFEGKKVAKITTETNENRNSTACGKQEVVEATRPHAKRLEVVLQCTNLTRFMMS